MYDYKKEIKALAEKAAQEWWVKQARDIHTRYYLYYRKHYEDESIGDLRIDTEQPEPWMEEYPIPWELAWNEHINRGWTAEQAQLFIYELSLKLPILNPDL